MLFSRLIAFRPIQLLATFLSFFILLKTVLDPDLGWHLRMGEYIVQNRAVPWTNLFSYTLPNYQWVDSYWLTQICMYLGKIGLGLFPLAVIFALIAALAVWMVSKGNPLLMIFAAVALRGSAGVRPMTVSFLFLAFEVLLLERCRKKGVDKYLFLLIPLFALWANMHADWVIGLFIFGIYAGVEFLINSEIKPLGIAVVSTAATLLNPYTYHLWTTLFNEVGATAMHRNINEWLTPTFEHASGQLTIFVIALVVFLIIWRINKKGIFNCLPQFIFAILAMKSYYYLHILILISAPFILESFKLLGRELQLKKLPFLTSDADVVFQRFFIIGLIFTILAAAPVVVTETVQSVQGGVLADTETYPVEAVEYLNKKDFDGKMYNYYGWGGYLIYHLPEKKTFIDGRMPAWRKDGEYVFKEYLKTEKLQPGWDGVFRRYDIDWAILKNGAPLSFKLQKELGWKYVYTDETAVILFSPD